MITASWRALVTQCNIFKGNYSNCLSRQVYNSYVPHAMSYDAEI